MAGRTIIDLMETSVERFGDDTYLMEKVGDRYEGTSYRETRELVHRFAAGLMALGSHARSTPRRPGTSPSTGTAATRSSPNSRSPARA